jgi:hypothetical protein
MGLQSRLVAQVMRPQQLSFWSLTMHTTLADMSGMGMGPGLSGKPGGGGTSEHEINRAMETSSLRMGTSLNGSDDKPGNGIGICKVGG